MRREKDASIYQLRYGLLGTDDNLRAKFDISSLDLKERSHGSLPIDMGPSRVLSRVPGEEAAEERNANASEDTKMISQCWIWI